MFAELWLGFTVDLCVPTPKRSRTLFAPEQSITGGSTVINFLVYEFPNLGAARINGGANSGTAEVGKYGIHNDQNDSASSLYVMTIFFPLSRVLLHIMFYARIFKKVCCASSSLLYRHCTPPLSLFTGSLLCNGILLRLNVVWDKFRAVVRAIFFWDLLLSTSRLWIRILFGGITRQRTCWTAFFYPCTLRHQWSEHYLQIDFLWTVLLFHWPPYLTSATITITITQHTRQATCVTA